MPEFSNRSRQKLSTCCARLQNVFNEVIKEIDCSIVCGYRNEADQNAAYKNKFSKLKYPNSKHNKTPSLAVDVIPWPSQYDDEDKINELASCAKRVAKKLGYSDFVWGGDWDSFVDAPHYEVSKI